MMNPPEFSVPQGEGPRLFLSVGDHSGDLQGALLIKELKRLVPHLRIEGLGGEAMISAGMHCHYNMLDLGVMFFLEVLLRLPTLGKLYDQLYRYFEKSPPDLVVFMDYPGFNLFLSKKAKQCGIPTYYYIVPQLWAWAPWRIRRVKKRIDRMSVLFEFEEQWYKSRGMSYVQTAGHPLYDFLAKKHLNGDVLQKIQEYAQGKAVVGLMPGSRTREIRRNFPLMVAAAKQIQAKFPNTVFVVPCAKKKLYPLIKKELQEAQFDVLLLPGYAHEVMSQARACIATSGTVTIELLYYKVPTVVIYRIGWLAYKLLRLTRFLQCRWITLVNILAQEEIFPERLGANISPSWIATQIGAFLEEGEKRQKCIQQIEELHRTQIKMNASRYAAEQILDYLQEILEKRSSKSKSL